MLIASLTGAAVIVGIGFLMSRNPSPAAITKQEPSPASSACSDFQEGKIVIGEKSLDVAIAATAAEKAQGLSGCSELPKNAGMLFPYDAPKQAAFWMKNMLMPLDIIWIRDGKVVGLEANVPVPRPNAPEKNLPQYHSPGPVDHVLEIKAGGAAEYEIKAGSDIVFE